MSEQDFAGQRSVAPQTLRDIPAACISDAQRQILAQLAATHTISYRLEGGKTFVLIFDGQEYELHTPDRWICRSPEGYIACTGNFVLWSEDVLFNRTPITRKRENIR